MDTVKLSTLEKWEKFPVHQVEEGIRVDLSKGYADQGKGEKYLLGIIRNLKHQGSNDHEQERVPFRTTGSALLDGALRYPEKYRPVVQ